MQAVQATPEQIGMFKAGAAQRYQERGVPADVAEQLFENHLAKQATQLGLDSAPAPMDEKRANEIGDMVIAKIVEKRAAARKR
jgi:hypothetical protein